MKKALKRDKQKKNIIKKIDAKFFHFFPNQMIYREKAQIQN